MQSDRINILLIEDCDLDAKLMFELLTVNPQLTNTIKHVKRLSDGMDCLRKARFDLVLTDLNPPDSGGLETIATLRDATACIPIVVLTDSDEPQLGIDLIRAGADDFLPKNQLNEFTVSNSIRYSIERSQFTKQIQKQLEAKNKRLSALFNQSQQFVDNVSHEFRTPLTVIREFAAIVRDGIDGPVTEKQQTRLNTLINRTDDLARMVEDLLDTSKLESGLIKTFREKHNLSSIFESVESMLAKKAKTKKIDLQFDKSQSSIKVYCDEEKLRRILMNLVTNAIKFTPFGGNIWVRAAIQEQDRVSIVVEDNGPGIAADDLQKIFERFHQSPAHSRMASCKGFGLGLSIARALAHLNLGSLHVASVEGKGSRFSVKIPLANVQSTLNCYIEQRQQDAEALTTRLNILQVDCLAPDEHGDENILNFTNEFLHANLAHNDLVLRVARNSWLVLCNISDGLVDKVVERLRRQWTRQQKSYVLNELPELSFTNVSSVCLKSDHEALANIVENRLVENRNSTHHAHTHPPEPVVVAKAKALIVDDELDLANVINERLQANHFQTRMAHDGASCLSMIDEFQPDVIALDIRMPNLDGLGVLKRLKSNPATASIPVVVLSASLNDKQRALDIGASYFIQKPFRSETMLSALESAMLSQRSTEGVQVI